MMRLHRHIGVVALIGPMSVTAFADCDADDDVPTPADVVAVDDVVLAATQ